MAKVVVAVYEHFRTANAAVRVLVENGFPRDEISMIALDEEGNFKEQLLQMEEGTDETRVSKNMMSGAGTGAGVGAVLGGIGGLLVGLGIFAIPGFGPVLAGGPLAAALAGLAGGAVGAVAGGGLGGLIGILAGMGIPQERAKIYVEGIRQGGVLVAVRVDEDMVPGARSILNQFDPVDVEAQAKEKQRETQEAGLSPEDRSYKVEQLDEPVGSMIATEFDQGFEAYDDDYREHFANYLVKRGYDYTFYLPAYQYGYALAADERYRTRDWNEIEPEVRQKWEQEARPAPWDEMKEAVRFAWEEVRQDME